MRNSAYGANYPFTKAFGAEKAICMMEGLENRIESNYVKTVVI